MGGSVWIINPDLLTATIVEHEQSTLEAANLAAVQRVESWLDTSIAAYQTIGVETVLSSDKYRRLIGAAHDRGFEVRMIYVLLDSVELQMTRIGRRVREGGHDVPPDKVAARRLRSFEQFAWFAEAVNQAIVFNNSSGDPMLAGVMSPAGLVRLGRLPADFLAALQAGRVPVVA